ncbi:MAG: YceI family protein [Acetobacter papayae]
MKPMKAFTPFLPAAMVAGLLLSTPVFAADWTLAAGNGTLGFSGTQTGKTFEGHFTKYDGSIAFDPAHPEAGHAKITIDMASATTGDAQRDGALPGHDWFDVKTFPTAVFEVKDFKAKGGNAFDAEGTLTIKGVSKPVTLPLTIDTTGTTLHAKGHLPLVRSAFNVGIGPWSTGQWVALDVGVDVDVTAQGG